MTENSNASKDVIRFWKHIYYEFHDLVKKEGIFSKLPLRVMVKMYYNERIRFHERLLNSLKNILAIPALMLWKIFPVKIERVYYRWKYPGVSTLENLRNIDFNFLFILNTKDHIITALPVLENLDKMDKGILVVTLKRVYYKFIEDFNKLENAKIVFFEYELKNLPFKRFIQLGKETKDKMKILKSCDMDKAVKEALLEDLNYIKFHIKTELIQYHFFKNIFENFNLKGVVSIVFTTAFEIAKEKNIPTFILQHGIGGTDAWPNISDYIFAYDDETKAILDELLDNTVAVLPLGAPRFEYLAEVAKKLKRNNFNTRLGKPVDARNVTYISVGTKGFENKDLFLALKELRQKLPDDVNLIIKLHPRENLKISNAKKEIKEIFSTRELKETVFIRKEIDFYEILANSDIVISTVSTGMLESIAMDIPSLQINFTGRPYPPNLNLSSFGWKEPISDSEIMINEVLAMLNDEKRRKEVIEKQRWLRDRVLKNFGRCGEVIAETIVNICEKDKGDKDKRWKS